MASELADLQQFARINSKLHQELLFLINTQATLLFVAD